MTAAWVAGIVRGRGLAQRRLGPDGIAQLTSCHGQRQAMDFLASTSYGAGIRPDTDLAAAERNIADTALWHLRILAGWVPPAGAVLMRPLTLCFEIWNIEELALSLHGDPHADTTPPPFDLGRIAMAWPRVRGSSSLGQLRIRLADTPLGDPGRDNLASILLGVRLGWARILVNQSPDPTWGLGLAALELAKSRFLEPHPALTAASARSPLFGDAWHTASDLRSFRDSLPTRARWVLSDIATPEQLWRAEAIWWQRLARDGAGLLSSATFTPERVLGTALAILADARLTQLALSRAGRALATGSVYAGA